MVTALPLQPPALMTTTRPCQYGDVPTTTDDNSDNDTTTPQQLVATTATNINQDQDQLNKCSQRLAIPKTCHAAIPGPWRQRLPPPSCSQWHDNDGPPQPPASSGACADGHHHFIQDYRTYFYQTLVLLSYLSYSINLLGTC